MCCNFDWSWLAVVAIALCVVSLCRTADGNDQNGDRWPCGSLTGGCGCR